ncbi:NAD-dependent epimerase/dehydratase family protein [Paraburkholderia sediminicola]|uniref:NAD-dependent epimerase/dehydratase family protein n=1 Tax=Paraburkholderia sediminicola TaxID=458836 RepID=UPI0038B795D6
MSECRLLRAPDFGLRDVNIEGRYNLFEASRQADVKRVVFASSNHAVGFRRHDQMITNAAAPHLRMAQPSRHGATDEAQHRLLRLPLRDRARRVGQRALPLGQNERLLGYEPENEVRREP